MEQVTDITNTTLEVEVVQFVKENNMDAIVERMVKQAERIQLLQKQKDWERESNTKTLNEMHKLRGYVRDKFKELMDGDKDATVEMELDDFNEILDNIGAAKIAFTYSVEVTATVRITGIEADSEEEAEQKALEAVSLRIDTERAGDDADYEDEEYTTDNTQEEDN